MIEHFLADIGSCLVLCWVNSNFLLSPSVVSVSAVKPVSTAVISSVVSSVSETVSALEVGGISLGLSGGLSLPLGHGVDNSGGVGVVAVRAGVVGGVGESVSVSVSGVSESESVSVSSSVKSVSVSESAVEVSGISFGLSLAEIVGDGVSGDGVGAGSGGQGNVSVLKSGWRERGLRQVREPR